MEHTEQVELDKIDTTDTQTRAVLREEAIQDYAERIEEGVKFDPAVLIREGEKLYLSSGFHRFHAHRRANRRTMPCIIKEGSKWDAIEQGIKDNLQHRGERLTRADRAFNVHLVLRMNDQLDKKMSDREIARLCNVSPTMVGTHRKQIQAGVQIGHSPTGGAREVGAKGHKSASATDGNSVKGSEIETRELPSPRERRIDSASPAASSARTVDPDLFFKECAHRLGRFHGYVADMKHMNVGPARRILDLTDEIAAVLAAWRMDFDGSEAAARLMESAFGRQRKGKTDVI